jgi:uncharacterized LabA/DUF88 family protein
MVFVDGENFTIRGQEVARKRGVTLIEGKFYRPDTYLWPSHSTHATRDLAVYIEHWLNLQPRAARAFYYTSVAGDNDRLAQVRMSLWELGFDPSVFRKAKSHKAKGVDIALTTDLLANAYMNNYDVAVVLTGDADYAPALTEVKRLGKTVCVMAFEESDAAIRQELRLSSDHFVPLDNRFFVGGRSPNEANRGPARNGD